MCELLPSTPTRRSTAQFEVEANSQLRVFTFGPARSRAGTAGVAAAEPISDPEFFWRPKLKLSCEMTGLHQVMQFWL